MKLSSKIIFHPLTVGMFLLCLLTGYVKYIFYIFMIITLHELGHITIAFLFHRKIESITFLPLGGLVKMNTLLSADIFEDILIASGGVLFQTLFGFIIIFVKHFGFIDNSTYEFISSYNRLIILFNLLPICPLDGYKMFKCLSEVLIPYKLSFTVALLVSIMVLISITLLVPNLFLNNIFVFIFLMAMSLEEYRSKKFLLYRFYVERLTHTFEYPKKEVFALKNFFKNRTNYVGGIHEKRVLEKIFTSKNH